MTDAATRATIGDLYRASPAGGGGGAPLEPQA